MATTQEPLHDIGSGVLIVPRNGTWLVSFGCPLTWPPSATCLLGPGNGLYAPGCQVFDFYTDDDVDLADMREFQVRFTSINP